MVPNLVWPYKKYPDPHLENYPVCASGLQLRSFLDARNRRRCHCFYYCCGVATSCSYDDDDDDDDVKEEEEGDFVYFKVRHMKRA